MTSPALARRRIVAGALRSSGVALVLASVPARAQPGPPFDARTWKPSADADASMVLEPTTTAGPGRWNVGAWAQYAQDAVVFHPAGAAIRPVQHLIGLDLVAGLGLGTRFAMGVEVPLALWQDGTTGIGGPGTRTAPGDIPLGGKATLISNDHQGVHSGFGLAALGTLSASPRVNDGYMSSDGVGAQLRVLAGYAVGICALRGERGYATNGPRTRWPQSPFAAARVGINDAAELGESIPWAFGLVVRPKVFSEALDNGDRQRGEIAAHGSLPAGPVAPFGLGARGASLVSPALLAFDDRIALGHPREVFVLEGGDLGLDSAVGVPTFRIVFSLFWAPRPHDKDGDGIDDDKDECPDLPEDHDGIQDADGCPEDDADGDEILDKDDACPLVPGVPSSDPKQNGCPGQVVVTPPAVPVEEVPQDKAGEKTP